MNLNGKYTFNVPREKVYEALVNPEALQQCIPGCQKLELMGEGEYRADLKLGVAAVRGSYIGKVKLSDQRPPEHFTIAVEGSGGPGFVKGQGAVDLTEEDGKTIAAYSGEAQIGGTIAGVGQRMLGGVANMLVGQFFKCLDKRITP